MTDPTDRPPARTDGPDICQTTDAYGRPVCVRTFDQRPCATCPQWAELDAIAAGLDPEQQIRARALDVASYVIGDVSGTVNGVAQHLIDLAEPLVDWIRDGKRPLSCYQPTLDETRQRRRP